MPALSQFSNDQLRILCNSIGLDLNGITRREDLMEKFCEHYKVSREEAESHDWYFDFGDKFDPPSPMPSHELHGLTDDMRGALSTVVASPGRQRFEQWLRDNELGANIQAALEKEGFDTIAALQAMEDSDVEDLHLAKGYERVLKQALRRLRESTNLTVPLPATPPQPAPRQCKKPHVDSPSVEENYAEPPPVDEQTFDLKVKLDAPKSKPVVEPQNRSILVRNVENITSERNLKTYFQNNKRSGGGEVTNLKFHPDKNYAVVEFKEAAHAQQVVAKHSHELDEKLYVSMLPPLCRKKVFIPSIPSGADKESLALYMETCAMVEVASVDFTADKKSALISFNGLVDLQSLTSKMSGKRLKEQRMEYVTVYSPNAIVLYGVPSSLKPTELEMPIVDRLDSEKCGDVLHMWHRNTGITIVIFSDHEAVDLFGDTFNLSGHEVLVAPYIDVLGVNWSSGDTNNEPDTPKTTYSQSFSKDIPQGKASILSSSAARDFLQANLDEAGLSSDWAVQNGELIIPAKDNTMAKKVQTLLLDCIKTVSVPLDSEQSICANSPPFCQLVKHVETAYPCHSKIRQDHIEILCLTKDADSIRSSILEHLANNTQYTKTLANRKGVVSFMLSNYGYKDDLDDLKSNYRVRISLDREGGLITAIGTKSVLLELAKAFERIRQKVCMVEYTVKRVGMSEYFSSPLGKTKLKELGMFTETIILTNEEDTSQDLDVITNQEDFLDSSSSPGYVYSGQIGNTTVKVFHGDITKLHVDAIVNAANEDLDHGSGVAGAIVRAGGMSIQQESSDSVAAFGKVVVGTCRVTRSGNLPCKRIIHVVGPRKEGEEQLEAAVVNALKSLKLEGLKSIAIPAISCGIFGYPADKAVPIIVKTALKVARSSSSIVQEITFVDSDSRIINLFHQVTQKECGHEQPVSASQGKEDSASNTFPNEDVNLERCMLRQPSKSTPAAIPRQDNAEVNLQNGEIGAYQITLVKGNIAEQVTDVIVNATGLGPLENGGPSCTALFTAGGPTLLADAQVKRAAVTGEALVIETVNGNLKCKRVYHLPMKEFKNDMKPVTDRVIECIRLANAARYTSISFPAIGTGGNRYPRDQVAAAMFDAVARAPSGTATNIRFILFPKDVATIAAFERELCKRCNVAYRTPQTTSVGQPVVQNPRAAQQVEEAGCAAKVGDITIEVIRGDIVKEDVDCVLCPTNSKLNFSHGGVANALKAYLGLALEDAKRDKTMPSDGVLLLKINSEVPARFRYILCIDAPNVLSDWAQKLDKGLQLLEEQQLTSIAMPAVGTGQGGSYNEATLISSVPYIEVRLYIEAQCARVLGERHQNVTEVAEMMFGAIERFARRRPKTMHTVHIVILQDYVWAYSECIAKIIADTQPSQQQKSKGWLSTFKGLFGLSSEQKPMEFQHMHRGLTGFPASYLGMTSEQHSTRLQHRDNAKQLILHIYGASTPKLALAESMIETVSKEICPQRVFEHEVLKALSTEQATELKRLANYAGVSLHFYASKGSMVVEGSKADAFIDQLRQYISNLSVAIMFSETVQWHAKHIDKWEALDPIISMSVEKAYRETGGKTVTSVSELDDCLVDFDNKVLVRGSVQVPLKRKTAEDKIPTFWESTATDTGLKMVHLQPGSAEYQKVHAAVHSSLQVTIEKIERVEMPARYIQYATQREVCDRRLGKSTEQWLFHGTQEANVAAICKNGFNRTLSGVNGTAYGNGCYFASTFKYSSGYGSRTVFYCQVVVGECCVGNSTMKVAPKKPNGDDFDATVNDMTNPTIYVVYTDNHFYPAYLITYSK